VPPAAGIAREPEGLRYNPAPLPFECVGLAPTDRVLSAWSARLADWLTGLNREREHAGRE
jgi:hypothetical protein